MPDWRYQTGFRAGEVANSFLGSFDQEAYRQSARKLENCVVTRRGSAKKRGGTRFLEGVTSDNAAKAFSYSNRTTVNNQRVVAVITKDDVTLFDGDTEAEITTIGSSPYTEAQIPDVFPVESRGRLILLHPEVAPRVIDASYGATAWPQDTTFPERDGSQPRLLQIPTTINMALTTATTEWTFSAPILPAVTTSEDTFFWYWKDGLIKTTAVEDGSRTIVTGAEFGSSGLDVTLPDTHWTGPCHSPTAGSPTVTTGADPKGDDLDEVSILTFSGVHGFTDDDLGSIIELAGGRAFMLSKRDSTTVMQGICLTGSGAQIVASAYTFYKYSPLNMDDNSHPYMVVEHGEGGNRQLWASIDGTFTSASVGAIIYIAGGELEVVSFTDGQTVTVTENSDTNMEILYPNMPHTDWAISPNNKEGYPSVGVIHQNRLFYGGFPGDPQLIVASATNDHFDFTPGSDDDDPMSLRILDDNSDGVKWMHSTDDDLIVGTGEKEIRLAGNPLTPTNLGFNSQSFHGGALIKPVQIGIGVIFSDFSKQMLRETSFVFEKQRYQAVEVNAIASHLFDSTNQVIEMHVVRSPEQGILTVRSDGQAAFLSRNLQQEINAWSTWPVSDLYVESAATVQGSTGDKVWMVVKRTINGTPKRYIEIWEPGEPSCDSRKAYTSPGSTTLTGLSHLEGEAVRAFVDGGDMGSYEVSGGQIEGVVQADTGTDVQVGLGFNYECIPHPMIGQTRMGLTAARGERVGGVHVLVSDSLGGSINAKPIIQPSVGVSFDMVWDKHSGWVTHFGNLPDATHRFPEFSIVHVECSAFEILAIGALYEDTAEI